MLMMIVEVPLYKYSSFHFHYMIFKVTYELRFTERCVIFDTMVIINT